MSAQRCPRRYFEIELQVLLPEGRPLAICARGMALFRPSTGRCVAIEDVMIEEIGYGLDPDTLDTRSLDDEEPMPSWLLRRGYSAADLREVDQQIRTRVERPCMN